MNSFFAKYSESEAKHFSKMLRYSVGNSRQRYQFNQIFKKYGSAGMKLFQESFPKTLRTQGTHWQLVNWIEKAEKKEQKDQLLSSDALSTLVARLAEQLQLLRKHVVESHIAYDLRQRAALLEKYQNFTYEDWRKAFTSDYDGGISRKGYAMRDRVDSLKRQSEEAFVAKSRKTAEKYFDDRIEHLAAKLIEYKINVDEATVETNYARFNVHFDVYVKDADKTLHARTIVAEGPIVRAHYRFIIT